MLEFDVETRGLQWYDPDQGPFLAQFFDGAGEPAALPISERDAVQAMLTCGEPIRAWNAKFDLHMADAAGFELPHESLWHDAMVKAHICDERGSVSLAARSDKLLPKGEKTDRAAAVKAWLRDETKARRKVSKETGEKLIRPNYSDVPDEIMLPYAKGDVVEQRQVADVYDRILATNDELRGIYDLEQKLLGALFYVEKRGIPVEREDAVRFEAQILTSMEEQHDRCVELAGKSDFNPGSPQQVGEALKRVGADTSFMTETKAGNLRTDEENLLACPHPLAAAILEFRGSQKIHGTYLHPMLHRTDDDKHPAPFITPEGRVHSNIRQVGARTGRMSSAEPNIQNWHRDDLRMRYLVKASPGNVLISCDLDAVEARLLAAYAGPGRLLEAFRENGDIHSMTAKMVGLRDFKRPGGAIETARQRGKRMNYLVMYSGGVRAIRKWFGVSQAEGRQMLERYHDAYPEIRKLQNRIEFALMDRGYVKTLWGRHLRPDGKNSREIQRESYKFLNYVIQGTAAEIIKEAVVSCHQAGIPVIAAVHDEILAEVPREDAVEAARFIEQAMVDHPRVTERIPLLAEAWIGERWSGAKDEAYRPPYAA